MVESHSSLIAVSLRALRYPLTWLAEEKLALHFYPIRATSHKNSKGRREREMKVGLIAGCLMKREEERFAETTFNRFVFHYLRFSLASMFKVLSRSRVSESKSKSFQRISRSIIFESAEPYFLYIKSARAFPYFKGSILHLLCSAPWFSLYEVKRRQTTAKLSLPRID